MGRLIDEDDVIREIEKHKNHVKEGYVSRGADDHGAVELYFLAHEHIKELIAVKVPPAQQEEVTPHRNYQYLSDYWCECGWHLGKKGEVKYCSECGRKVNWGG